MKHATAYNTPREYRKALDNISDTKSEPENLFELSDPSLLVRAGRIAKIHARIHIEDWAGINHISQDFCERRGITLKKEHYTASMASSTPQSLLSRVVGPRQCRKYVKIGIHHGPLLRVRTTLSGVYRRRGRRCKI